MKHRIIGTCLRLLLLLGAVLPAGALEPEEYPKWPEMREELAVRYTLNGGEVSRVEPGDVFKMEFWINGIDPYSLVLPISWDPSIAAVCPFSS